MLDVFKSIAGGGGQANRDQADALHRLLDRAQEERAALGALLQVVTLRNAKLAPLHGQLEHVDEKVATVGSRVDDLASRLAALDARARDLETLDQRIRTLTDAVDNAERTTQRACGPEGELQAHRGAVERLTAEARDAHSVFERVARDRAGLDDLACQLRATEQSVRQGVEQATALTGELDRLRSTTDSLQQDYTQLRELSQTARTDAAAAVGSVTDIQAKLVPLTQLQTVAQDAEERLARLHALAEDVALKSQTVAHQQHVVEHAVVQTSRVADMVWAMDVQIKQLNESQKQITATEDTLARIERLVAETATQQTAAVEARADAERAVARLKEEAKSVLDEMVGRLEALTFAKQEVATFDERVQQLQTALQDAESRMLGLAGREKQVATLARQVERVAHRVDPLCVQADELGKKQAVLDGLHSQIAQVRELATHTNWQMDALRASQADLDHLRQEMQDLTVSHASMAQMRDQLRAERQTLEAFGDKMTAMSQRASSLDGKLEAVLRQFSLIDDGAQKAARVGHAVTALDAQMAIVERRVPVVEAIERRLDRLNEVSASVDTRLKEQIAQQCELDIVKTSCGDLLERTSDIQRQLEAVQAQQARVTPLVAQFNRLAQDIEVASTQIQEVACDEATLAARQTQLAELQASSRGVAADVAQHVREMQALARELEQATTVKHELLAELDEVQNRQRETIGRVQATDEQLARAEKALTALELRGAQAAVSDTKLASLEARFADVVQLAEEVEQHVTTIAGRETLVQAVKAQVDAVHQISARSKADLAHVVSHRTDLTQLRTQVDRLLARVAETDDRLAALDARSRIVEQVDARAEAVAKRLDDVRAAFDLLGEQKAVVEQVAEQEAQLEAVLQQARRTTRTARTQRDLAGRLERTVGQLQVRPSAPAQDAADAGAPRITLAN